MADFPRLFSTGTRSHESKAVMCLGKIPRGQGCLRVPAFPLLSLTGGGQQMPGWALQDHSKLFSILHGKYMSLPPCTLLCGHRQPGAGGRPEGRARRGDGTAASPLSTWAYALGRVTHTTPSFHGFTVGADGKGRPWPPAPTSTPVYARLGRVTVNAVLPAGFCTLHCAEVSTLLS